MERKRNGLISIGTHTLRAFVPEELRDLPQLQTDLPRVAKDRRLLSAIDHAIQQIPTMHDLRRPPRPDDWRA